MFRLLAASAILFNVAFSMPLNAQVLDDFEQYSPGPIASQGQWDSTSVGKVVAGDSFQGDKSLLIDVFASPTIYNIPANVAGETVYFSMYIKGNTSNLAGDYNDIHWRNAFYVDGGLENFVVNLCRSGPGLWSALVTADFIGNDQCVNGVGERAMNEWARLDIEVHLNSAMTRVRFGGSPWSPSVKWGNGATRFAFMFMQNTWANGDKTYIDLMEFSIGDALSRKPFVVFFPGFGGSRLWWNSDIGEDQLWLPSRPYRVGKTDLCQLRLSFDDTSGGPAWNSRGVYTKSADEDGLLDYVKLGNVVLSDIYGGFISYLEDRERDGTIAGFQAIPYDWRLGVDEVAQLGLLPGNSDTSIIERIKDLSSQYGPVTLIGHSNGGLVTKALLVALEAEVGREKLAETVDRAILIATPQLGTPRGIAGLLHGEFAEEVNWGGQAAKREAAETMPGGYGLLPSRNYFARRLGDVVTFEMPPRSRRDLYSNLLRSFVQAYGTGIDSVAELNLFLQGLAATGQDQLVRIRNELVTNSPYPNDLASCFSLPRDAGARLNIPNVTKPVLLAEADDTHAQLDSWTSPTNVAIHQIAGIGKSTPKRVDYKFCKTCQPPMYYQYGYGNGDGTVIRESALGMAAGAVDYEILLSLAEQNHMSILSAPPTQSLLTLILKGSEGVAAISLATVNKLQAAATTDVEYAVVRLRAGPVANYVATVNAIDGQKRRTGMIDPGDQDPASAMVQKIPGSTIEPVAGHQTLTLIGGREYRLEVDGRRAGKITLEVAMQGRDERGTEWMFPNIDVQSATLASLTLTADGSVGELDVDFDGDGRVDTITVPTLVAE